MSHDKVNCKLGEGGEKIMRRIEVAIFNNIKIPDSSQMLKVVDFEQNPEVLLVRAENLKKQTSSCLAVYS